MSFAIPTYAANHLYSATVALKDSSQQQRTQAINKALSLVLIKLSGNESIMTLPAIQHQIEQPQQLIQQYSNNTIDGENNLTVMFSQKRIETILRNANQAIWTAQRPVTLAWITYGNNVVMGDSEQASKLQFYARQRGLTIIFPTPDLINQTQKIKDAITKQDIPNLKKASNDYSYNSLLIGQLQQKGSQWQGEWLFTLRGNQTAWHTAGVDPIMNFTAIVNDVFDNLASQFAIMSGDNLKRVVMLSVKNVHGLKDYAQLKSYFLRLVPVTSIDLVQVDPTSMTFKLHLTGTEQGLQQAISMDNKLKLLSDNGDGGLIYKEIGSENVNV